MEVETPLLDESVNGALYVATPYENEFNSLIALYMVIKNRNLGIMVKQGLKVEPDPVTGRLTTIADNLPQLPFSHFRLRFREGTRSPLASPPGCGTYNATAQLFPWAGGPPATSTSTFQIISGPGVGPLPLRRDPALPSRPARRHHQQRRRSLLALHPAHRPQGRRTGDHPLLDQAAPGRDRQARRHPLLLRRGDRRGQGPHRSQRRPGRARAAPPAPPPQRSAAPWPAPASGPSLAYAPGKIYLAGPYHGSALSIVAITAAKVGPFDLGTVVVRQALQINPETAEVFIDATGSDPIPHIIKGIPVHAPRHPRLRRPPRLRLEPDQLRTHLRPPPRCSAPALTSAPPPMTSRSRSPRPFQAADCAALGFAPKLALSLKGGTKRGGQPEAQSGRDLRRKGSDANIASAQVTLPHSEFLDQSHIKTICTRVQFAAGNKPGEKCPPGSIYGFAKATTPLLSDPVEGPVFLRSSSNPLPDLVAALHNEQVDFNLVGRIDSVKGGDPQHLRDRPRRPGHQVHPGTAGRQEEPSDQQHQHLQGQAPRDRRLHRAERQEARLQPGARGEVPEEGAVGGGSPVVWVAR